MTIEIVFMWAAITLYVLGTVLFVGGVIFARPTLVRFAVWASVLGLAPHVGAFAVRWARVGHGPYLGYYEVTSALAFFAVGALGILSWRYPKAKPVGIAVMPVVVLLLAAAMLAPKGGLPITPALVSYWLVIHVVFALLSFGAFLVAFGLATIYLIRARSQDGRWEARLESLPSQEIIDDLSARFVGAGFLLWGIMIASGAIWANEAWGRYWAWDPIETWSLVTWLVYAVYLHLRLSMGWRGRRTAWIAVVALLLVLFALVGVPLAYNSVHAAYLTG